MLWAVLGPLPWPLKSAHTHIHELIDGRVSRLQVHLLFGMNGEMSANLGDNADDLSVPEALARFVKDGVNDGDSAFSFLLNALVDPSS